MGAESEIAKKAVEALGALRKEFEAMKEGQVTDASFKEMRKKTEEALEAQEKANQELVKKSAEEEKKREELETRVKDFELELAKQSSTGKKGDFRETKEYKALNLLMKVGESEFYKEHAEEAKALNTLNGTEGGYLVTTEMDNQILKELVEVSPMRSFAKVRTISSKTLEVPKRTGIPTASYVGEMEAGGDSQSSYASESLTPFRQTVTIPVTTDLLMDSKFDIMSLISSDVREAFAFSEGRNFIIGDGIKKPEGILQNAAVVAGAVETAGSLAITGDDIIKMTGNLKVGYNPMFVMNRQVLAYLRTLKGTDGHYLWQMGLSEGSPNLLAGDPYALFQDMPGYSAGALVAGEIAVVYGDFARGYMITDRTGMEIIRDNFTSKKSSLIEITFHRYNTGQVVLDEAFTALKIKA